jgi:nucleoside-diphosphate-sugar epimerase
MRVLVIGGTNFIGPYVVGELHRLGHEVTVYHRGQHEPQLPEGVRHIHSPRAGIPVLHFPSRLSDPPPDVVLHMYPIGEDDTRAAVARFSGVTKRLVLISSGDVYRAYGRMIGTEGGDPERAPLDESAPVRQTFFPYRAMAAGPSDWMYHYEKLLVERAGLQAGSKTTVLRLPAVYGPGDPQRRLRPYIKRMLDRRPGIVLEAAIAAWRWSHGYVEDVAHAVACAVIDERAAGKVYNVGEADVPTTADRARRLGEVLSWKGDVVAVDRERAPRHLLAPYQPTEDLVMETGRIRSELGFREKLGSDDALRRTIEWERKHPPASGDPDPAEYAAEDTVLQGSHRGVT